MEVESYVQGIVELARKWNENEVSYDHAIRSAAVIAERFGRDPAWSSVDFENACKGKEIQ